MRRAELTGHKFGFLLVTGYAGVKGIGKRARSYWICLCECGRNSTVCAGDLIGGYVSSCGCITRSRTHGDSRSTEHRSWLQMKDRCLNENSAHYSSYGGRGIKVCKRWLTYENFLADMGRKSGAGFSLDRIDNNGNYCPENCRWATASQQARNTRQNKILELNGEKKTLAEWAEEHGLKLGTLWRRLNLGWSLSQSLAEPLRRHS